MISIIGKAAILGIMIFYLKSYSVVIHTRDYTHTDISYRALWLSFLSLSTLKSKKESCWSDGCVMLNEKQGLMRTAARQRIVTKKPRLIS